MNFLDIFEGLLAALLVLLAFLAVNSKKMLRSILYLSLVSMLVVVGFVFLRAPDVAITEAVIGSGLVTAVFLFTLATFKKAGEES